MDKNKKNEELQSRREFFKKAAKGALPILGAIVLGSTPLLSHAAQEIPSGCNSGCSSGCYRACSGSCKGTCIGGCKIECRGHCQYNCQQTCSASCTSRNSFHG